MILERRTGALAAETEKKAPLRRVAAVRPGSVG